MSVFCIILGVHLQSRRTRLAQRFSDGVLGCGDMNEIDADQCQIRSDDHVIEQASMNSVKIIEFVFL